MLYKLRHWVVPVLVFISVLFGLTAGVILDRTILIMPAQAADSSPSGAPNFQLIQQAWDLVQQHYVDRAAIQTDPLTYGAISGMISALGDTGHSTFLSPDMLKEENNYLQGHFNGIGAQVEEKNGQAIIVAPIDGSPAQKAGLRPGDVILKVNGQNVNGLPLEQVVGKILGPVGTPVTLTLGNSTTGATRDVTIVRARITVNNVTWVRLPGTNIADVRIAGFSQGVSAELKTALESIQQQGMTAVVLDLRNNPGGALDEAVGVTSQFMTNGNVLLEKDAQGHITPVAVQPGGVATRMPMAVLVNGGTASAAEIVVGGLQDAHRAIVVGETTFGTGTVLNQFPLSDGSALLLATQEWLTPAGHSIWHKGITPDQVVTLAPSANILLPEAARAMTPGQLQASGDAQLLRAVQLLHR